MNIYIKYEKLMTIDDNVIMSYKNVKTLILYKIRLGDKSITHVMHPQVYIL